MTGFWSELARQATAWGVGLAITVVYVAVAALLAYLVALLVMWLND